MFEDADVDRRVTEDQGKSSITLERWAHFPAFLVFGALILPLHSNPWGWHIAIAGGYTVYVFCFALGSGEKDLDDLTGDTLLLRKIASLLLPHLLILVFVVAGVTEWFHLRPLLPTWATHEGRKPSLWFYFGLIMLAISGYAEGSWFAKCIRRQFVDPDEHD